MYIKIDNKNPTIQLIVQFKVRAKVSFITDRLSIIGFSKPISLPYFKKLRYGIFPAISPSNPPRIIPINATRKNIDTFFTSLLKKHTPLVYCYLDILTDIYKKIK